MTAITSIRYKYSNTDSYKEAFDNCYLQLKKDDKYSNRITFGIIAIAYLEYICNSLAVDFFETNFTKEISILKSETFTWLPNEEKVKSIVSIITTNDLRINESHNTIQALLKLINIRNRIVHKKDVYKNEPGTIKDNLDTEFKVSTSDKHLKQLSPSEADRFYNSIINFVSNTFDYYDKHYTLRVVDFIIYGNSIT